MTPAALSGQFGDTTYTKVFVGGLAWETQKETMRKYFEQFGEILEAVVITDKNTGRSKGYGFGVDGYTLVFDTRRPPFSTFGAGLFTQCVTFREPEAAMKACVDSSPVIDGRRANCNLASLGVQRSTPSTPKHASLIMPSSKEFLIMSMGKIFDELYMAAARALPAMPHHEDGTCIACANACWTPQSTHLSAGKHVLPLPLFSLLFDAQQHKNNAHIHPLSLPLMHEQWMYACLHRKKRWRTVAREGDYKMRMRGWQCIFALLPTRMLGNEWLFRAVKNAFLSWRGKIHGTDGVGKPKRVSYYNAYGGGATAQYPLYGGAAGLVTGTTAFYPYFQFGHGSGAAPYSHGQGYNMQYPHHHPFQYSALNSTAFPQHYVGPMSLPPTASPQAALSPVSDTRIEKKGFISGLELNTHLRTKAGHFALNPPPLHPAVLPSIHPSMRINTLSPPSIAITSSGTDIKDNDTLICSILSKHTYTAGGGGEMGDKEVEEVGGASDVCQIELTIKKWISIALSQQIFTMGDVLPTVTYHLRTLGL
ncbi:hypothetical protein ACLOJK_014155 [Asimina triloba]